MDYRTLGVPIHRADNLYRQEWPCTDENDVYTFPELLYRDDEYTPLQDTMTNCSQDIRMISPLYVTDQLATYVLVICADIQSCCAQTHVCTWCVSDV